MTEDVSITDYLKAGRQADQPDQRAAAISQRVDEDHVDLCGQRIGRCCRLCRCDQRRPRYQERIAAAKIVMEKTDNADRVLRLMGEFGANIDRYANHHPWAERLARDSDIGAKRSTHDMRLSVLNYPLQGWVDAVVMNFVTGHAVVVQLGDMARVSYQPLADAIKAVLPSERRHVELAEEGLARLKDQGETKTIATSLDYWQTRSAMIFGDPSDARAAQLRDWGLRHASATEMRARWGTRMRDSLDTLGIAQAE